MDTSKVGLKKYLFFIYCVLFPFGQLPSILLSFVDPKLSIVHPADLVVFLYVLVSLFDKKTITELWNSKFIQVLYCLVFCTLCGSLIFHFYSIESFFYLSRLLSYLLFGYFIWRDKSISLSELNSFFVVSSFCVSIGGLFQYFFIPDTRMLKLFGWDDHYLRLISSFLDPAFTGIFLVLSLLYFMFRLDSKPIIKVVGSSVISLCLLLTYSRSSYLSFGVAFIVYLITSHKIKLKYILIIILFTVGIFLVPKPNGSEGVNLVRVYSVISKIDNSRDTVQIIKKSPLFGVGYNNLCQAKTLFLNQKVEGISHSCSGSDNSFLFILATTGFVGLLLFIWFSVTIVRQYQSPVFLSLIAALFVHTQFTNTLFYTFVMGWIILIIKEMKLKE